MANTIDWGKATQNNTNGFGKYQNTIGAASVYAVSAAGETVIEGTSAAFSYPASSYHQDQSDPTPTITGTAGGTFSATPSGLSINTSTGTIDLDASTIQSYTITYTVSGVSANQTLAVTASPFIANTYSMEFDGINDSVIAGTTSLGITSAISVSCWIKTTNTTAAFRSLVAEDITSGSNRNWNLLLNSSNKIGFIFFNTSGSTNYLVRATALEVQDGNWHHILATYDGTSNTDGIKIYVDGGNVETLTALSTGIRSVASVGPRIGSNTNGSWNFTGKLDEVAIWNTALSSDAVQEIYDATNNNTGKALDLTQDSGNYNASSNLQYFNRLGD